jgi:hypothetical protein
MTKRVDVGDGQFAWPARFRLAEPRGHWRRCRLRPSLLSSSTFLRSLRSMAVTPLPRSYGRSDSCPPHSWTLPGNACSTCGQVSLIHALGLPTILSPNTCGRSAPSSRGTLPPQRVEPRSHPLIGSSPGGNSGLHLYYAGSPRLAGRIEFRFLSSGRDFLRTGRSPPAALHPVLPRRSCSRLQVTLTWRGLSPLRPSALSGARSGGLRPPGRRPSVRASSPAASTQRSNLSSRTGSNQWRTLT